MPIIIVIISMNNMGHDHDHGDDDHPANVETNQHEQLMEAKATDSFLRNTQKFSSILYCTVL